MTIKVLTDIGYYNDPATGRPLFNAQIFVGIIDLKPAGIPGNQIQVSLLQEDGSTIPISQPIRTNVAGQPTYNGVPATLVVDDAYSLQVLTAGGSQVSYSPNVQTAASSSVTIIAGVQLLGGGPLTSDVTLDFDPDSPAFTGAPTAPTQPQGTNNTTIATTAFVMNANANIGQVSPFASSSVPAAWIECDGSALDRTEFNDLFAIIGITYGPGNGTTTFNIPDMRGIIIRGWDHGKGTDVGRVIGTDQDEDVGPHNHFIANIDSISGTDDNLDDENYTAYRNTWGSNDPAYALRGSATAATKGLTSEGDGTETRMANLAMMYCIKTAFGAGDPGGVSPTGVNSVTQAAGILVTGTVTDPVVGWNYSVVTVTPGINDGIDGQVFFVVDP